MIVCHLYQAFSREIGAPPACEILPVSFPLKFTTASSQSSFAIHAFSFTVQRLGKPDWEYDNNQAVVSVMGTIAAMPNVPNQLKYLLVVGRLWVTKIWSKPCCDPDLDAENYLEQIRGRLSHTGIKVSFMVGVAGFEPATTWTPFKLYKRRRPLASFRRLL